MEMHLAQDLQRQLWQSFFAYFLLSQLDVALLFEPTSLRTKLSFNFLDSGALKWLTFSARCFQF